MALRRIDPDSWPEEILESARMFFNCFIDVFKPGSAGTYDPATDTYTGSADADSIIASRAARAQHIRLPLEESGAYEWSTKRRYRFQIELLEDDPAITKGAIVRVKPGGRDPILQHFAFEVVSASNSSHAALRTIETITDLAKSPA